MKIVELMSKRLVVAKPGETLAVVEKRMSDHGIHALPVLDEFGRPEGILTTSDCGPDVPPSTLVEELFTDQVYQIDVDADAREAARMMRDLGVHHLVVTEKDGRAVGMLSSFDLLRVIEEGEIFPVNEN